MVDERITVKELCLDLIELISEGYGDVHVDINFTGMDFKSLIKNSNVNKKTHLKPKNYVDDDEDDDYLSISNQSKRMNNRGHRMRMLGFR